MNLFLNSERQLRNGWWIAIFILVLVSILLPTLLFAQKSSMNISMGVQAVIVFLASYLCQLLRRQPLTEMLGKFDIRWCKDFFLGSLIGSALMLIPALVLSIFGLVGWQWNSASLSVISSGIFLFIGVAIAEEVLFRGFVFQRLIAGLGEWPAQLIVAVFFLLTHLNNPGMSGTIKLMAGINIFLASIMFGLAFIRTKSLAMPLGLHFMANWIQGGLLGFGVSGTNQSGLLKPVLPEGLEWVTGGNFGLEASIFGLLLVVITLILLYKWKPS